APHLFVRDAVVDEKDGNARVSVLLGGPGGEASNSPVTVDFATSAGSATAGADYSSAAGTLTFAPGETAKTVVVPINDDALTEPAEEFALTLSNPAGATILDGSGVIVIGASDAAATALPAVSAPPDVIVGERDGFVDLVVSLSAPGTSPVTVNYSTFNSTAGASNGCNADYVGASGTLTFAPGETTKVVRVQLLDCALVEPFETFLFQLSTPGGATIARSTSQIGIIDSDSTVAAPHLFVRDAVVDEKDGNARVS